MNDSTKIASWLIRRAARSAPGELAARLEEEWLADLTARRTMASRLRFAVGCYWATQVIAFENRPSRVLVAGAFMQGKGMAAPRALMQLSRRSGAFVIVVLFHALLFYLVLHAVTHSHIHDVPPLVNQVMDVPHPYPPTLPHMDDPVWEKPPLHVPPPEPFFPPENDGARDVSEDVARDSTPQPPDSTSVSTSATPHAPVSVQGGPGAGFPNPDDYYPSFAKRMEEQGSVTVQVCVDTKGRLTANPVTTQTSGNARLDQGALKLATAASGHYRASTEDGRPVSACYPLRVRFQIKN